MVNGDVLFTTKFRLDLDPNKTVEIYDDIDYSGLGEDINDFVGIVKVSGPSGVIYENTDFNNPDIVPGTSRQMTTLIYLILDALDNYQVMKGQYTIKYSVKNTVSENTYENTNVYGFHFDVPTMAVDVDSGPYSAKLRSDDETDYGSNVSLLTREHRIKYPTDLGFDDIVVTAASHEVDPIYTNLWTTIITSTVDYKQVDDLEYRWYGTETVTHCVTGACISSFYSSVDEMLTLYQGYIGTNPNMAGLFRERLQQINTAWQLLDIAWMYVDLEEADKQSEVIRELIENSGIDLCPSGPSIQVDACPSWGGGQGGGFYTPGVGINIDVPGKVISLSHLGFENLTGPGADKMLFWDNTAGALGWADLEEFFDKLKISSDDTTIGYLEDKFTVSHGVNVTNILNLTTLNPGGNEIRQLQLDESKISHDNIAGVSVDDHHDQAHVLATIGDHTGALPLTDLDNYVAGALVHGGAADWEVLSAGIEGYVLKMGAIYPVWETLDWSDIIGIPTTFSGYGISDTLVNLNTAITDAILIDTGDSRLSDSRTPTAHASSHLSSGGDTIANFTPTVTGLVPLSGGGTSNFLRADGLWEVPPGTSGLSMGATTQIPYMNVAGDDFLYSAGLVYGGSILGVTGSIEASTWIKAVYGFTVGASGYHVFHKGDENWQVYNGNTPTWNMTISRNFEWNMTSNGTLIISNANNGSSGVLILRANGSYTCTLPTGSTPSIIIVTPSDNVLAVFTKVNNGNYIWSHTTFLDPI